MESKYVHKISINGEEHPAKVYNKDIFWFFKQIRKTAIKHNNKMKRSKKAEAFIIPNEVFYEIIWKCLIKTGFWFWRKPFRSKRQMIALILKEEMQGITNFVAEQILNEDLSKDEEKKEVKSKKKAMQ